MYLELLGSKPKRVRSLRAFSGSKASSFKMFYLDILAKILQPFVSKTYYALHFRLLWRPKFPYPPFFCKRKIYKHYFAAEHPRIAHRQYYPSSPLTLTARGVYSQAGKFSENNFVLLHMNSV